MHFKCPSFVLSSSHDYSFRYQICVWMLSNLYCMSTFTSELSHFVFFFLVLAFSFLHKDVPLVFIVMLVWWCQILFACLWRFWILHQIWMRALLSILGCQFLPFIILNIWSDSLLACRVSAEKSVDSLIGIPLHVTCTFPCWF